MESKEKLLTEAVERFKYLSGYNYESKGFAQLDGEKLLIKEGEEVSEEEVSESEVTEEEIDEANVGTQIAADKISDPEYYEGLKTESEKIYEEELPDSEVSKTEE